VRLTPWLNSLDVDRLTRLLRLRTDVTLPDLGSVQDLAEQLSTPTSVAAAVDRLDRDCLLVAQSVVVLGGDGTDIEQVQGFVRGGDQLIEAALERLTDRALVWPGTRRGSLRVSVALHRHWPHPLGLSRPTAALLDPMTKDPIRDIAQRLGVPKGSTRDDAVRNVCQAMSDAPALRKRAASSSPTARALLEELVWNPISVEPPRHVWEDRYRSRQQPERLPAEELYDLGLLIAGSDYSPAVLPRQAMLALRGPHWGPELTGAPQGPPMPKPVEFGGAGPVVLESLDLIRRLVEAVAISPLTPVKTGELGQREVQRVARSCGVSPDRIRFWLEIGVRIGLLGPAEDGRYRPTAGMKTWQALEVADQWAHVVGGWWRSTERSAAHPPGLAHLAGPVLRSLVAADTLDVRRAVVDVLSALPPHHTTAELAAAVAWLVPAWPEAGVRAEGVLVETEALGITVAGVITPVGRAVTSGAGDVRAEAVQLLPAVTSTVAVQSDLTAVAVGAVPAATASVLDAAADREGVGVWRFSRSSVRRALDAGRTGADLTAALTGFASTGLPQVLTRLIDDVTRIHGSLRVTECGCCLVAVDESLLMEVLGARAALQQDLHRVAPTVAVGSGSATELVIALRELGYAPVIDPLSGAAQIGHRQPPRTVRGDTAAGKKRTGTGARARNAGKAVAQQPLPAHDLDPFGVAVFDLPGRAPRQSDPLNVATRVCHDRADLDARLEQAVQRLTSWEDGRPCSSRLEAEQLLLLARAQEEGLPVLVAYSRSFDSRGVAQYLLDEVSLGHAQLRAWNSGWESDAVFDLYGLVAVEPG